MTQQSELMLLEMLRDVKTDVEQIRGSVAELYSLIKGNGRPGLRQTQDELEAMREACRQHKKQLEAVRVATKMRSDSWAMFFLRPIWPIVLGLIFFGALRAASMGTLPL